MAERRTDERAERLQQSEAYQHPERECDVVMKGGITSGVLYPLAVCELATVYRLRNIGGTSAGGIAAAAAAAAEYGRTSTAPGSGFEGLAGLPEWLGEDDHLVDLFQPPEGTRSLHALLMGAVRPGSSRVGLVAAAVWSALRSRRWWLPVVGSLPGALLAGALLAADAASPLTWVGLVVAVVVALIGVLTGTAMAVVLSAGESLVGNMYGIVSGSQAIDGRESLSDWLTDQIDTLASIGSDRHPLTFGDLWAGPPGAAPADARNPAVNLEMQTTNITEGRPYRLPHQLGESFAFHEEEFRKLFPARVVDYLIKCAGDERTAEGLVPLPSAERLPVVVATRMSLSFPVLLSAVPLYAVDRSMQHGEQDQYERCWFSDGGITSNFPVSFFDALLPSRPTFGINLRPFHPNHPQSSDECRNLWMPRTNKGGIVAWWTRWPDGQGVRSVAAFLRAIADTMQNWVDNQQIRVPGYRDRIVHISHSEEEGGMNLAMPPDILAKLTERGRCAGARLVEYYTNPPDRHHAAADPSVQPRVVSWENHRWIRLRTSLALVADAIESLSDGYDDTYAADLTAPLEMAPGYQFKNLDQRALAQALMSGSSDPPEQPTVTLPSGLRQIAAAIREIEARGDNVPLDVGAPSPHPVLRITPGARAAQSGPFADKTSDDPRRTT